MGSAPNYGIDSPAIVTGLAAVAIAAGAATGVSAVVDAPLTMTIGLGLACLYLLSYSASMVIYSKRGKLHIRDRLLDALPWRGDERVLDVGCGTGLLVVGAAGHLTTGRATGLDRWIRGATSRNRPQAVRANAQARRVGDRVELCRGDVSVLPFRDDAFDVVVSNFVVHELSTKAQRAAMVGEVVRVLKPGGRVALVDFVFTRASKDALVASGLINVRRAPISPPPILTLGLLRAHELTATKPT
jgi:SAM-dependent methyltransferase